MNIRQMVIQMTFRVISNGLRGANEIINRLRNGAGGADGAIRRMSAGMQKLNGAAGALIGTLGKVAAAMGVAFSAVAIKNAADEAMNLDNKLRVIYKDDEQGRRAMKDKIFDMANDARGSYTATGDLFYKVARTSETTGLSLDESARLAEIVSKGLSLSGADTGTAEGAILQLGQALSSGVLQGDELHALNEGAGALMQEMAKSMGVKIGDLKEMGKNGELTSDKVARAILASGDEIDRQFATHVPTIGQAMQTISNTWTKTIGDIQDRTNVFGAIAEGLISGIKYVGNQVRAFMDLLEGKDDGRAEHPILAAFVDGVKAIKNEVDYVKGSIRTFFAILEGDESERQDHPVLAAYADVAHVLQEKIAAVRKLVQIFFAVLAGDEETRQENPQFAAFAGGVNAVKEKIEQAKGTLSDYYEMLGLKIRQKQEDGDDGQALDEGQAARLTELQEEHPLLAQLADVVTGFGKVWDTIAAFANAIKDTLAGAIGGVVDAVSALGMSWGAVYEDYMAGVASIQQMWANLREYFEAAAPILQFLAYIIGAVLVGAVYVMHRSTALVFRALAAALEWISSLLGRIKEYILSLGFDWDSVYEHFLAGIASLQKAWADMQIFIEAIMPLLQFIASFVADGLVAAFFMLEAAVGAVFRALQFVAEVIIYTLVNAFHNLQRVAGIVFDAMAKQIEFVGKALGGLGEIIQWLVDGLTSILTLGSAVGNMKMPEHQWGDWKNAGGGGYSVTNNKSVYAPQYVGMDPDSLSRQPEKDVLNFAKGF